MTSAYASQYTLWGAGEGKGIRCQPVGGRCLLYFLGGKSCDTFVQPAFFLAGNCVRNGVAIVVAFKHLFSSISWQSWITSAHVQRRGGLGAKLVSFTKGFSKHPHILAIFKVDSEYLRFPFKVKVDYFILYSILVYSFVIFLIFFAMNKRRCTFEAEQFFHSNVYMFKRKQKWTTAYQHVISRASHISVSIKGTFWYLSFFFLEWTVRTKKIPWSFSSLFHCPAIAIRFTNKVHTRLQI